MSTTIDVAEIERFHGHMCPGLAIGVKAAEIALREIGPHSRDEEVVAITETDICAVDAIQYLTGCTFGKGNLIYRDHGKVVFTFIRRADGKAIRVSLRGGVLDAFSPEHRELFAIVRAGTASEGERVRFQQLHVDRARAILDAAPEDLFDVTEVEPDIPAPARIHQSLVCEECGEAMMETRARFFRGQTLCIPCFERKDRRFPP